MKRYFSFVFDNAQLYIQYGLLLNKLQSDVIHGSYKSINARRSFRLGRYCVRSLKDYEKRNQVE